MPQRNILHVPLAPIAGDRFQPTGFPDLGAATFKKFDRSASADGQWVEALLVESEQSMANHLEGVGWDRADQKQVDAFNGLPYVQVVNADGEYLTSSRTEAHRLASAFIREGKLQDGSSMIEHLRKVMELRDDKPLSARSIASAIFSLDPLALVHGVFFADNKLPGQPKIARALTSFVEAVDVQRAEYGGVKKDDVSHSNAEGQGSTEGFGSIPFHRTLWTARSITASFVLDLDQLRSYGLPGSASRLLEIIALWEIRNLLDGGMRLRTMCDLAPLNNDIDGLPSADRLGAELRSLIEENSSALNSGNLTTVVWTTGKKGKG